MRHYRIPCRRYCPALAVATRGLPPIILTETSAAARRPWSPSTLPAWWARKLLCCAHVRPQALFSQPAARPRFIAARPSRNSPGGVGTVAPPRPNPREALTSWCATIVDRDWRPAHGIPSSLSLDSLPTTILHQPPIPPSPTYNMTLCSYKADRAHDPILKSVLHSPPDMHHPARTCGRKHSSASPLHGHGLLPRGLPETALEEWAPWPNPGEAHIVVCDDRRS